MDILNAVKKRLNPGLGGLGGKVAVRDLWAIYGNPKTPDTASTPGAGSLGDDGTVAIVGTDANEIYTPTGTDGTSAVATSTPLGSNGTYTSKPFYTQGFARIIGSVFANQAGTVYIDQSPDGVNWDVTTQQAVTASTGASFSIEVVLPYARIRYTNGASAQATFRLNPFLRRI